MLSIWLISSRKGAVSLTRKVQSLYFEWYYFVQLDQSWFNVKNLLVRFKVIAQSLCLYSHKFSSLKKLCTFIHSQYIHFVIMGHILS